jgi:hypothetical protein
MAGFVIETVTAGEDFAGPLKLVDVGECEELRSRAAGHARVAWARWRDSRQLILIETADRLLLIEGQPDRPPAADEELQHWLTGRGGSFRGFQLEYSRCGSPMRICAFVDPLGTRPIYLLSSRNRICLADKLSTIVANTRGLECDWGGLLEGAVLASMYSTGTSIRGVEELLPGEVVEIEGASISHRHRSPYTLSSAAKPDPSAPARLTHALQQAVAETWTQRQGRLLLSGGLDSRLILALAEGPRKVMTVDWYPSETEIVREVAAACGAELEVLPFAPEDYCERMRSGFLVTGAMHQSRYVTQLGMTRCWRSAGIPAITHGYFHNTVFRGWTSERWRRFPNRDSSLYEYMGANSHYFDLFGQYESVTPEVLALLSAEGRRQLKDQLSRLSESIDPVIVDGFDLTFERRLLSRVVRQVYFPVFLGWLEEIDVESPVFHPAVWDWYNSTHPADRYRDKAVHLLYQTIGRGLADIPDLATGRPVRPLPEGLRVRSRNQFWYPAARRVVRTVIRRGLWTPRPPADIPSQDWAGAFRQRTVLDALCAAVEEIKENPLFETRQLSSSLGAYLNGDNNQLDALWAVAAIGQWHHFVRSAGVGYQAVREIAETEAICAGSGAHRRVPKWPRTTFSECPKC